MAGRNRGSAELTAAELEAFVAAATELHRACCRPILRSGTTQGRVLTDLNTHVCKAIAEVTGAPPAWMRTPRAWESEKI